MIRLHTHAQGEEEEKKKSALLLVNCCKCMAQCIYGVRPGSARPEANQVVFIVRPSVSFSVSHLICPPLLSFLYCHFVLFFLFSVSSSPSVQLSDVISIHKTRGVDHHHRFFLSRETEHGRPLYFIWSNHSSLEQQQQQQAAHLSHTTLSLLLLCECACTHTPTTSFHLKLWEKDNKRRAGRQKVYYSSSRHPSSFFNSCLRSPTPHKTP